MPDTQAQTQVQDDSNDPFVRAAQKLAQKPNSAPDAQTGSSDDPFIRAARKLQQSQPQADTSDPFVRAAQKLRAAQNPQSTGDAERERMGQDQSFWTKPLTTSLFGLGEYRKEASPDTEYGKTILGSAERGAESDEERGERGVGKDG
jgi:predicted secreted protein